MNTFTRRDAVLGGSALAVAAASRGASIEATRRPNIVWIVCHDIHAPLLGCYGNAPARTVVDKLTQSSDEYVSRAARYLVARIDCTYTPASRIFAGVGGGGGGRAGGAPAINPFSDPQI